MTRSKDPRGAPAAAPPKDEEVYCLPMVPLPSIGSSHGYALWKRLHKWKKKASEAHWEEWEIRAICAELALPVPGRFKTPDEVAAETECPF